MQQHPNKLVAENLRRELDNWKRAMKARDGRAPSQAEIGHMLGISQGAVSQYLNAKIPLGTDALLKWASLLKVPPQKIDPGFSHRLAEDAGVYNLQGKPITTKTAPLIQWNEAVDWANKNRAAARAPDKREEQIAVTTNVGGRAYALRVRGDSMEPVFPEGSIIIVDPDAPVAHSKYVVVRLDDDREPMFKQLIIDGGKRYLKPLNPRYPVIELTTKALFCGVVKQMLMDFD